MAIDREATLKKAEKLLRQGKLDGAIAEYVRLVQEQPKDWNSINALGDLYVRAGQIDHAVQQFARIADHLYAEGFLPKAAAVYKKILKITPDDEHTVLQLADIAARQGVLVDARRYYRHIVERRKKKGDEFGAAQIVIRIGELDAGDAEAKIQAARAAQSINDTAKAVAMLTGAADALEKQKRLSDALAALTEAVALAPEDEALRGRLLAGLLEQREIARARTVARTSAELLGIAELLERDGKKDEWLDVLIDAAQLDAANLPLRARVVRECVTAGRLDQARMFLTPDIAGDDPDLLLMLARIELQSGRLESGREALNRVLALQPERRDEIVLVGIELADQGHIDGAFACVDLAANAAVAEPDWGGAAAALHEFVTRVPHHVPALMKLVEICVDGGLESTMYMAQAQLADAYLAAGRAVEARVIAEDLVAREPWLRANIERFRRALIMLGIADPDAVIAERLSGESPFLSTIDLGPSLQGRETPSQGERPEPDPRAPELLDSGAVDLHQPDPPVDPAPSAAEESVSLAQEPEAFALELSEIDLSDALGSMGPPGADAGGSPGAPPLEQVFEGMRSRTARESELQRAQELYASAAEHARHGRYDEAIVGFTAAARVPQMRFEAGSRLGRLYIERGDLKHGVEWLENAVQAPPPSRAEGHAVLYEYADGLERLGEAARALVALLELQADAGDYRDVAERIERLSKVQAGR